MTMKTRVMPGLMFALAAFHAEAATIEPAEGKPLREHCIDPSDES
jgi:hypothetical protein